MLRLGIQSLINRRVTALLTVIAIALSVAMILGVERLRNEARDGFTDSASGIDVIVSARGNPVQILMATVFGVGSTGNTMSWDAFEMLKARPDVAWAVPISMGDNHRGYPVIGTTPAYFDRFRHSGGLRLSFASGTAFARADGAVVGADVAARFGYEAGAVIVNAHGAGQVSFDVHGEAPFTITGILAPTGTATDRMVFVSLEGFDGLHASHRDHGVDPLVAARVAGDRGDAHEEAHDAHEDHADKTHTVEDHADAHDHSASATSYTPVSGRINAAFLGLRDRAAILTVQRALSEYPAEPLTAVMPNVALLELWSLTGTAENALRLMAGAVALAGMLGMVTMLFAALEERRREFAILRSVGATPWRIFGLIVLEAAVLTGAGIMLGIALLYAAIAVADPVLATRFGLRMGLDAPGIREIGLVCVIFVFGLLASLFPAYRVYRITVSDGLTLRL